VEGIVPIELFPHCWLKTDSKDEADQAASGAKVVKKALLQSEQRAVLLVAKA
jgi:hypothetical protein